jgi:large subunit ribosomal protein L13
MSGTPYFTKDTAKREWYVVDVNGQVLGRAAAGIAKLLTGKNKPEFTPGQDCGAFVVVINADKIRVTGAKLHDKIYYRASGYPGGLYQRTFAERMNLHPEEVIRDAVKGMLPRNKIGNRLITKLKVYTGENHPHAAQEPVLMPAEQLAKL